MKQKKILITGGVGFIGQNLVEELSKNPLNSITATWHKTKPRANSNANWKEVDLLEEKSHKDLYAGQDVVIMCAADTGGIKIGQENSDRLLFNSCQINQLTLRSAVLAGVEHILFPSCSVMYKSDANPQTEEDVDLTQIHPQYVGGAAMKLYIENLCRHFSLTSKTKFTVIRHTNCYGPHDKYDLEKSHVFAASLLKVLSDSKSIKIWGNGEESRDFIHVRDVVNLFDLAISKQKNKYELMCCGSGSQVKIKDLINQMLKVCEKNMSMEFDVTQPSVAVNISLDSSKARFLFGWEQKISLVDGIRDTADWVRATILKKN